MLDLEGAGLSMLQSTVVRLRGVAETITVVTGAAHAEAVRNQLAGQDVNILVEPTPRDSLAAIAYATYDIANRYGTEAIVGSFAADHVVSDLTAFNACVKVATNAALSGDLVTIGIDPTGPATGFGYIEPGPKIADDVFRVSRFVEKPDLERAQEYVQQGFYWNAGMFVARAETIRSRLLRDLPQMDRTLSTLVSLGMDTAAWNSLPRIAIDYALAEPMAAEGLVSVVPAGFDWTDIGDFAALAKLSGKTVFARGDKEVVVLGSPQVIVVDDGEVLLVTDLDHVQDVKAAVDNLAERGRSDLL